MNAQQDPLYQLHAAQAKRRGVSPLPYVEFRARLPATYETDLSGLLPDAAGFAVPVQVTRGPKFRLGQLCLTPAAAQVVPPAEVLGAIARHVVGDWGGLAEADRQANEAALREGGRLFSVYQTRAGRKFYVITESDRRTTTVLLPEDY